MSGSGWNETLVVDGEAKKPYPNINSVGPRFFELLQTPLVAGRTFDARDTVAAPRVAIVNEAFGRAFHAGALGRNFASTAWRAHALSHRRGDTSRNESAAFAQGRSRSPSAATGGRRWRRRSPRPPGRRTPRCW